MKQGCKGFSLIELLVVIAVLAVLMALVTPATMSGIRYAKKTQCSSAMRTTMQAVIAYGSDNEFNLPGGGKNGDYGLWRGQFGWAQNHKWHIYDHIKQYIGMENATASRQMVTQIACEATWKRKLGSHGPVYLFNGDVDPGSGTFDAWGYPNSMSEPKGYEEASKFGGMAFTDIDQSHPFINPSAGWFGNLAPNSSHGSRNAVFFDAHVETLY